MIAQRSLLPLLIYLVAIAAAALSYIAFMPHSVPVAVGNMSHAEGFVIHVLNVFQMLGYAAGVAEGFTITPFAAGHLVGGCAWRITTPEDEDIVYAVHYNHRKQVRCGTCMLMSKRP